MANLEKIITLTASQYQTLVNGSSITSGGKTYNFDANALYVVPEETIALTDIDGTTDLQAIENLTGTSGFLKKTGANTWSLDTNTYLTNVPLAANGTRGGAQIGYTTDATNRNYAVQLSNEKMYVNVPWTDNDTKVTSATNHYTPSTVSGQDKTASASGATAAWSIDVVKGITINTDGKGHITGLNVTSGKIPSNPNTDTKLTVAEVTSGTTYYPIVGTGTTAATRQYDTTGFVYKGTNGTTSAVGSAQLTLGNSTASGTANNKQGKLVIYGSTAYAHTISGAPTAARTLTLPDKSGTVALTSDLGAAASKGVTDNSSNADVTSSDTNLITARTLYYQLANKGYTTNTGTVTSVAASGSGGITISGSPITTSGTIAIGLNLSTAINGLGEGTSPAQLDDYLVAQFAGGGTTTTTYHRRKVSNVVNATVVKAALGTNSTHNNQFLRKDGTWQTPSYPVTSVAGKTGTVTLAKGDVGLGNVDNTADANKTVKDLTNFKVSFYSLPAAKGVRIQYPSHSPVLISCQRSNGGGRLILLGGGYGAEGTVRNDFTEVVSPTTSMFTWSLPNSADITCSLEVMNNYSNGDAAVWVWASNTCTFTEITALTTDAMNATLLTDKSSLAWNKLIGKPTTISGYGITDAKIASGVITLGSNTITPITNIAGKTGSTITADALRTALGLSNAMHFLGVTTTNVSTGTANTTATVAIGGSNVTASAGDVVLYGSQEYVWGNSKWNLLGDESSYALKATTLSGYGITDAKIASGVITLGSNTITPLTAASNLDATKLTGTIPASCYTDTNTTYSLSGALSSHKFTSTLTAGGSGTGTSTSEFTLAAGTGISLEDNTSTKTITIKNTVSNTDEKVKQNSSTTSAAYKLLMTTTASPTSGNTYETNYATTLSYNPSTKVLTNGTITLTSASSTSANGNAYDVISLGNSTDVTSTTAHSEGKINIYSAATKSHIIVGKSTTTDYTHTLPNQTGLLVTLNSASPSADVGSTTKPVYVSSAGVVTEASTYAGGTKVTLNGTSAGGSTASFYAPTGAGTSGQYLKSSGSGAPSWTNFPTIPSITLNGSSTTSPSFYAPTTAGTSGYYLKSNGSGAPSWTSFPTIPSITLNGSSTTSPSFYAPTGAGTSGQYLKSNGSGAPTWANMPAAVTAISSGSGNVVTGMSVTNNAITYTLGTVSTVSAQIVRW